MNRYMALVLIVLIGAGVGTYFFLTHPVTTPARRPVTRTRSIATTTDTAVSTNTSNAALTQDLSNIDAEAGSVEVNSSAALEGIDSNPASQ